MRLRIFGLLFLVAIVSSASLRAQQSIPPKTEVFVIPFSHLDLYWACTQEECLSRGDYIISRAIQLAKEYPEYRFLLETEVFVNDFVESHRNTTELEDFRRLVKQGRIEIAPLWVATYQNALRGEALARNLVYGKRYARTVFGVDPKVAHLADIPGFTRQYPQLLSEAATPYMFMARMGPTNRSLFHWKAPDGSSVLVWNAINGYGWGAGEGLHLELDKERLANLSREIVQVTDTTAAPVYLGFGTDLFGPSDNLVGQLALLNQRLPLYHFRMATADEFFRAAAVTPNIPDISGEIPSSWANLTTSLLPLWLPAMSATDTLVNAEKFAAINYALGYAPYPEQRFESLWKDALKSLDHNNDGQGGRIGDERRLGYAQEASLGAGQILRDSLRNIAERVQSPIVRSTPIVVFNPLSWTRDDVVRSHITLFGAVDGDIIDDYKKAMRLVDEKGKSVPFQIQQYTDGSSRAVEMVFIAESVPSMGYKTYYLVPAEKPDVFPSASEVKLESDNDSRQAKTVVGSDVLDGQFYRVSVSRSTGRVEIFDKELKQIVTKNAEIVAAEESGGDDQNIIFPTGRTLIHVIDNVELEENGPVRTVLRMSGEVGDTPVTQRLTMYRRIKKIDFDDTIDWKPGSSVNFQQIFPILQPNPEVRNGIPFGTASAADIMPNAGPHWDDEVAPDIWKTWRQIQDWVFAGTKDWGFTISADHQLVEVDEHSIRADMLRGTRFSPATTILQNGQPLLDARPPAGSYAFRHSFTSGPGDWVSGKSWRAGMEFSTPLIAVSSATASSAKPLSPEQSFCSLDADNLVLSALKKSDTDGSILLRAFEIQGKSAESSIHFLGHDRFFRSVNLLEEDSSAAEQKTLHVNPYQIDTIKLRIQ